jgi:hypothetical protein
VGFALTAAALLAMGAWRLSPAIVVVAAALLGAAAEAAGLI